MNHLSTKNIVAQHGSYIDNPKDFFSKFPDAWTNARFQVVKLETRQVYREPGNESYEALEAGAFDEAVRLMEKSRQCDIALYESLEKRGIDFIRCRPVVYPISEYLRWEMESYKFNAKRGEKIYFTEDLATFKSMALHDFMVFDRDFAVVHDYSDAGEIMGGWVVRSPLAIDDLLYIFALIKSRAGRFEHSRAYQEAS